jgi:4-amino-4-deoxychorismate lyase
MVTRSGARGYRILPNMPSELVLQVSPLPVRWQGQCIVARWCQTRWAQQPLLAGIKHANRLEQVLARSEWTDAAIAEGLVCDTAGHVISGTMSSLMVRQGKRILVANLNQCGIDSVARQLAMAALKDLGYSLEVVRLSIDVVHEADEVLLMNVVQGVAAVRQLADRVYPDPVLLPLLLPLFDLP